MGTPQTRKQKIDWMTRAIRVFFEKKPDGEGISKKALLSQFALQNSSTERTGEEILDLLEQSGEININGDVISNGSQKRSASNSSENQRTGEQ